MTVKPLRLNKDGIEDLNRKTGSRETYRGRVGRYEVFISESFSMHPEIRFRRFGIDPGEFPWGAYLVMLWIAKNENHFDVGIPLFFGADHDPELAVSERQRARQNTALDTAQKFVAQLKKARAHA